MRNVRSVVPAAQAAHVIGHADEIVKRWGSTPLGRCVYSMHIRQDKSGIWAQSVQETVQWDDTTPPPTLFARTGFMEVGGQVQPLRPVPNSG
jgi:hypothetical protein